MPQTVFTSSQNVKGLRSFSPIIVEVLYHIYKKKVFSDRSVCLFICLLVCSIYLSVCFQVRLTAQFVARNGRQFLTTLMNREQRNNQFDFLRPQHSLFQYFTRLLEQYTKVLIPPKDLMKRLTDEAQSAKAVMKQVSCLCASSFQYYFSPGHRNVYSRELIGPL